MFKKIEVPEHLSKLVSYFYQMEQSTETENEQYLLPSSLSIMGFIYLGSWNIQSEPKTGLIEMQLPKFYTVGQITCGYHLHNNYKKSGVIGVALQPDALWQILKNDISFLTNRPIHSIELFSKYGFQDYAVAFEKATTVEERIEIVINFFSHLHQNTKYEYNPAADVVKLIIEKKGIIKVSEICTETRLQERYLQRNFKKVIGTSIKDFIRCVRFNHLFTELFVKKANQDVETLIYLYNYYDLSHFHKDYKYFFKTTPTKEHKERFSLFEELITNEYLLLKIEKYHL